jgi:hypothetical protein
MDSHPRYASKLARETQAPSLKRPGSLSDKPQTGSCRQTREGNPNQTYFRPVPQERYTLSGHNIPRGMSLRIQLYTNATAKVNPLAEIFLDGQERPYLRGVWHRGQAPSGDPTETVSGAGAIGESSRALRASEWSRLGPAARATECPGLIPGGSRHSAPYNRSMPHHAPRSAPA